MGLRYFEQFGLRVLARAIINAVAVIGNANCEGGLCGREARESNGVALPYPECAGLRSEAMKKLLVVLFLGIIVTMIVVTGLASVKRPLWDSAVEFHWRSSPWSVATLFDAYFGFLTFYLWVAYKERTAAARVVWFILIMALGNMAMSAYLLLQLSRLRTGQPLEALLLRAK
jgi:uncharacterized protein DUF1475